MPSDAIEVSRERLLGYLLGELAPRELAAIDQRLLQEDAFADAFEEARNDLLDAYALDALPLEQRERARHALNLSSREDPAVAFSCALRRALGTGEAGARESGGDRWEGPGASAPARSRRLRDRLWRRSLAFAASVALASGLWWGWTLLGPGGLPAPGHSGHGGFVLLLRPAVMRGAAPAQAVSVPAPLHTLAVQIVVTGPAARYRVRVRGPVGTSIYPDLPVRQAAGARFIQFSIPHSQLVSGEYRVELERAGPGEPRVLRRYEVRLHVPG